MVEFSWLVLKSRYERAVSELIVDGTVDINALLLIFRKLPEYTRVVKAETPCSACSRWHHQMACRLPRAYRSALIVLIVDGIVPDKLFHDTSRYVSFVMGISAPIEPVKLHPASSRWLRATDTTRSVSRESND